MLSRPHPTEGWLYLQPADYRRTMAALIAERDNLADPTHSGPAPDYLRWVQDIEMPRLRQNPFYAKQFEAHETT